MMGQQTLRRFVPRAPRYILRPSDNQMLRFAASRGFRRSYSTRFINVSETGLAFLISRGSAPYIGELIKVEFPVPGGDQIAWFAKVVRLEEFSSSPWWSERHDKADAQEILVGIQFHDLPEGHRQALRVHLHNKFVEVARERKQLRRFHLKQFLREYGLQLLLYTVAVSFTVAILYMLSKPSPNYDPSRGTPWGQRFKFGF